MMTVLIVVIYFVFKGCQDAILRTGQGFNPSGKYEDPKRESDLLYDLNERFYKSLTGLPIKKVAVRVLYNVGVFFSNGFYKAWEIYHNIFGLKYIEKFPMSATLFVLFSDKWHLLGMLRHICVVVLGWIGTGLPVIWLVLIYSIGLFFFQIAYQGVTNILKRNR